MTMYCETLSYLQFWFNLLARSETTNYYLTYLLC